MDFAAGVYLSVVSSPPMTPYPPLYTVYVYTVYLFTQGGATVHKARSKIPNWLTVTPVNKLINTCRKVPLQVKFFR